MALSRRPLGDRKGRPQDPYCWWSLRTWEHRSWEWEWIRRRASREAHAAACPIVLTRDSSALPASASAASSCSHNRTRIHRGRMSYAPSVPHRRQRCSGVQRDGLGRIAADLNLPFKRSASINGATLLAPHPCLVLRLTSQIAILYAHTAP